MEEKEWFYFKTRNKIITVILLTVISLTFLPYASGYLLPRTNLELYLEHELILLGEISSVNDFFDDINKTPMTLYEITVLQQIRGTIEDKEITVVGLGSLNSTNQLDSQTVLSKGQQALLMLNPRTDEFWFVSPYSTSSDTINADLEFVLPPLKLFKAGIPIDEIHCKSTMKLALKSTNGSPICLSPYSLDRLEIRGWIK